uniref:Transmembrane protein 69 n=1 Tax=Amphilophus citrinellus TaxID=61819 RepID=A0A3Q0SRS3_AMPCI
MKDLWIGSKPALYSLFMAVTVSCCPELACAQLAYAGCIVSFLGGARWGFALPDSSPARPDWINLADSVVPSLIAWATVLMSHSIVPVESHCIMICLCFPLTSAGLKPCPGHCCFFFFSCRHSCKKSYKEKTIS